MCSTQDKSADQINVINVEGEINNNIIEETKINANINEVINGGTTRVSTNRVSNKGSPKTFLNAVNANDFAFVPLR